MQQLTIEAPAVDSIDLVLAAWSEAAPAVEAALATLDAAELDELEAQLQLRLEGEQQIPLWDQRAASAK